MKEMDDYLKVVVKGLRKMAKGVESVAEKVEAYAKTQIKQKPESEIQTKPKTKPAEDTRPTPPAEPELSTQKGEKQVSTAIEEIFQIISEAKNGVTSKELKDRTGYEAKKIHNVIFKLKKKGKIRSTKRGIYVKV